MLNLFNSNCEGTSEEAENDSLGQEKDARLAVEKAQAGLTEELGQAQGNLQTPNEMTTGDFTDWLNPRVHQHWSTRVGFLLVDR
ncbi:hypothetical protein YC2023_035493 [Brassica napus]